MFRWWFTLGLSLIVVLFSLVGVPANEVHVCGESSAINFVRELALVTGDEFEVRKYKRLTPLTVLNKAVGSFKFRFFYH